MRRSILTSLFVSCLLLIASTLSAKVYVVSVGISNYKEIPSLVLPEKDAKAVHELYKKQTKDVILLTGKYATKARIKKSLSDQFSRATENDVIVFFFSGHGYQGGICPYDISEKDLNSGLSYKEIKAILKLSKAKNKIIIADACFSGGLRGGAASDSGNDNDNSVILFLSSRSGETSGENPIMTNGFFTQALVRGLKGGADTNRDKRISAKEIFTFVSQKVKEQSKDKQHPVMWGNFDDGFVLMDWM